MHTEGKRIFFAFTLCLLTLARSWFKGNDRISNIPTVRIVSNRYFSCIKSLTNHRADTISLWVDYTNHFLINSMCNLILHGDYATWTSSHNYCSFRAHYLKSVNRTVSSACISELVACEHVLFSVFFPKHELLLPSASVNMASTSAPPGDGRTPLLCDVLRPSPSPTGTERVLGALTGRSEQIDPCQQHCTGALINTCR